MVIEHLKTAGVQQSKKEGKLIFTALQPWPGEYVNADGQFLEGQTPKRAAIFIGPEFGTVSRADLVAAAREAPTFCPITNLRSWIRANPD